MTNRICFAVALLLLSVGWQPLFGQSPLTFANPLLSSGADPWSIYKDGYYYYTHTTGSNITLWKTKSLAMLPSAEKKVVWTPPQTGMNAKEIWAPELHFLEGKWYLYFAADDGKNLNHRLWVLENASPDPLQGTWVEKGKLATPDDKWAIDGSIFQHAGKTYLIWSGWEGNVNGRQDIYIARMKNPWTTEGKRTRLSSSEYPWEKVGDLNTPHDPPHIDVNEGPEVLIKGDKVFLFYSASACWTDHYALGMLTASGKSNLLNVDSWKKSPEPVFKADGKSEGTFAAGHHSFFKSPNQQEDWILYHANAKAGQGCGGFRSPRMQKIAWNADGTPNLGKPVAINLQLSVPAQE